MKIGIVGADIIGSGLGSLFATAGNEAMFSYSLLAGGKQ